MRVIAGSARSIILKTVSGKNVRPTTDKTKETLFNVINFDVKGCIFLDLFSGSGAIGIEALSRGADRSVFVENSYDSLKVIKENLNRTHLSDKAEVINSSVMTYLKNTELFFDIIFMDPPFGKMIEKECLEILSTKENLSSETIIIVEASLDTEFSYLEDIGFHVYKEKKYKTHQHLFIRKD